MSNWFSKSFLAWWPFFLEVDYTRVAFCISGLENITNINHRKPLYCFSKYSPLRSIRCCMSLNQLSKHFCCSVWGISKTFLLYASTAPSGVENRWHLILFFTYRNKKKPFDASLSLYDRLLIKSVFWVLKNVVFWADVWELALSWWRHVHIFGGWFSWFLGRQLTNIWLCTIQTWLFCIVLMVRLLHVQFFQQKVIICLEVFPTQGTFVGFGSYWNIHTVDCCLLLGSYA